MTRCRLVAVLWLMVSAPAYGGPIAVADSATARRESGGLQLVAVTAAAEPTLRVVLPGRPTSDRSIEVRVPGARDGRQTRQYGGRTLFGPAPTRRAVQSHGGLPDARSYERDLPGPVHLLARATLEDDGVRFQNKLTSRSSTAYDMITASPILG